MTNFKKSIAGLLVIMLALIWIAPASAANWKDEASNLVKTVVNSIKTKVTGNELTVEVNGQQVTFPDQKPFIDNDTNRTYVPLRFVSEALGSKVDWDGNQQTAIVDRGATHIEMKIGSKKPLVNGKSVTLDAPARLKNARTVVPLRFVSEALGAHVEWIAETRTVVISDSATPEQPQQPVEDVIQFSGETLNPDDYETTGGWAIPYEFTKPGASIMEVTVDELRQNPVRLGNDGWMIFYDVKVTKDKVYVTQADGSSTPSPARMVLAVGNDVSRQRDNTIVDYESNPFTHGYTVSLEADPGGGTRIEDVSHIMLLYSNQVLAVKNHLYEGSR